MILLHRLGKKSKTGGIFLSVTIILKAQDNEEKKDTQNKKFFRPA